MTPSSPMAATPIGPVMLDVAGLALDGDDRRRVAHPLTGGVILFARNFASRGQLVELVASLRAIDPTLLIAVDHEGGRVQRFRSDGFTRLPAMRRLGALWETDPAEGALVASRAAVDVGLVLAAELAACDIDLSFTPVLDLDHGPSAIIGDRAFHRDPRVVAMLARSLAHGLLEAGLSGCGKHFPGHGHVAADSHVALPVDDRDLDTLLADDASPYAWIGNVLGAVMPAHVVYRRVDARPAGFSPVWLREILRGRFAYDGAIFSDDLSMEGASVAGDVVSAATAALTAGCDMVLVCNDGARADRLLDGLQDRRDDASHERLARLRRRRADVESIATARYRGALASLRMLGLVDA